MENKKKEIKKLYKIAFEVTFTPKQTMAISVLMSRMDLGIEKLVYPQIYTISWTTTTKINKAYKDKMKKQVKKFIELEGHDLIKIREIKYE